MVVCESLSDKDPHGCFAVNACVENATDDKIISRIVNEGLQTSEEFFYQEIKKGQESGEIANQTDARALARFLVNNISGIRIAAKTGADKKVYEDIVKVTLSVLD
jgi:TetR/AcrR family transcriptional repressor of nem operon